VGDILRDGLPGMLTSFDGDLLDIPVNNLSFETTAQTQVVINAAGKTDLAWCEANPREAFRSNVQGALHAARAARRVGATFIHFSSGCVWDGPYHESGRGFLPTDPVSPAAFYTWTKATADALIQREFPEAHILRPRQVFSGSQNPRNTLQKFLRYEALLDTPNSMTSSYTIVRAVKALIHKPYPGRIWNLYDRGNVTPFEVGQYLHRQGLRQVPQKLSKAELDAFHKPKRVDTVLEDPVAEAYFKPYQIAETLSRAVEEMRRS